MISAIAWLPLGVAAENPQKAEAPDDELEELAARAEVRGDVGEMRRANDGSDDSGSDDEWEEMGSDELAEMEAEHENSSDDDEEEDDPNAGAKAAKRAKAVAAAAHGGANIDAAMTELDMDKYDDSDDEAEVNANRLFGGGRATFHDTNNDDPYITVKDEEDEDDEDYPDDFTVKQSDLVMLAARTDDDVSHLEVYVYEEPILNGTDESNLYCHHDLLLPAFPLCVSWMDCPVDGAPDGGHANCVAVGTMYPGIEIWDLDVIDAVEPVATLGGYEQEDIDGGGDSDDEDAPPQKSKKKSAKKQKSKKSKEKKPTLRSDSHADAVLGLSWNAQFRNVLASASADHTVRVWDINTQTTQHVLKHHGGKVQAVEWNPAEPTVLLSGGFDHKSCVVDVRAPRKAAMQWDVGADVECAVWNLGTPTTLLVSNENGEVLCLDTRKGSNSKPLFTLEAHEKATTSLSLCPGAPSLLITCSTDKMLKLWDIADHKPSLIATNNPQIGAVFTAGFAPSVPYLVGCAGSKGEVAVWDILTDVAVAEGLYGKQLEKFNRAAALAQEQGE
jgi:periodic tryptophan protein 1|tara:strand:+ start:6919 stop:8592 length:1674 start_codon:yes stop_codon:yes gene_type:complete